MSKFELKVKKEYHQYCVSITHNGYQWTTVGLDTLDELKQVADAILNFLETHPE